MQWGKMEAVWSRDSSMLCWIFPDKWFPESYLALKLRDGKLAWQVELMKLAQREILARTEAAAPVNFAAVKLENAGWGSAYPEGFTIYVVEPQKGFVPPLVCEVSLTSDPKGSDDEPDENGVLAWLTLAVAADGSVSFSNFRVKPGHLSDGEAGKVKAATVSCSLIGTDKGKGLLFSGMGSKDGRFALGWTVRPVKNGDEPVDWSRWDPTDPDKLLRHYDWQSYGLQPPPPYQAVDFVIDLQTRVTADLPTDNAYWPWKRDCQMVTAWRAGPDGRLYALVENDYGESTENFWLLKLSGKGMVVKEMTADLRKAVNGILRERRPEVAAADYMVSYRLKGNEEAEKEGGLFDIPFVANAPISDQGEFQLSGTATIRLLDGTVAGVASDAKRLEPFVDNEALRKADEKLNMIFQAALRSMSPKDAEAFKQNEREWIAKRDADASQAVNVTPYGSTQQAYERAREDSLLQSTKKRIKELQDRIR